MAEVEMVAVLPPQAEAQEEESQAAAEVKLVAVLPPQAEAQEEESQVVAEVEMVVVVASQAAADVAALDMGPLVEAPPQSRRITWRRRRAALTWRSMPPQRGSRTAGVNVGENQELNCLCCILGLFGILSFAFLVFLVLGCGANAGRMRGESQACKECIYL